MPASFRTVVVACILAALSGVARAEEHPGTEAGARALLAEFLKPDADHAALTKALRPTAEDYAAVFEPEFAKTLEAAQAAMWDGGVAFAPKPGQTELLLSSATTEQLKAWPKEVSDAFPGGYKRAAEKFKDGLTVYRFKFVEPGKTTGIAFDGLIHVNGHWRIFPRPWAAIR